MFLKLKHKNKMAAGRWARAMVNLLIIKSQIYTVFTWRTKINGKILKCKIKKINSAHYLRTHSQLAKLKVCNSLFYKIQLLYSQKTQIFGVCGHCLYVIIINFRS